MALLHCICSHSMSVCLHCRSALASVVECCTSLAKYMEEQGPTKAMDVDELLLRESMDVIGPTHRPTWPVA